jgi:hypothetical protein
VDPNGLADHMVDYPNLIGTATVVRSVYWHRRGNTPFGHSGSRPDLTLSSTDKT